MWVRNAASLERQVEPRHDNVSRYILILNYTKATLLNRSSQGPHMTLTLTPLIPFVYLDAIRSHNLWRRDCI